MNAFKFFATATLTLACLGLTSCSDDDNAPKPNGNGTENPTVKPGEVFDNGVPNKVGHMSITTDANGLVTSISDSFNRRSTKFNYLYLGRAEEAEYDLVMRVEDDDDDDFDVFYIRLNEAGFASYAFEEGEENGLPLREEWWFEYDILGHLVKMVRSEGGIETTTITYNDAGNIVEVNMASSTEPETSHNIISYGDTPILNLGGIMLFDECFGIDMDEMNYAYYAGLMGVATTHLPLINREIESDDLEDIEETIFTWTLNESGLPVKVEYVEMENGVAGITESFDFNW